MFSLRLLVLGIALAWSGAASLSAEETSSASAEPCYVEKTICVPQWVTETRTVKCTEYRQEERQRVCITYKSVPVKKTVECSYTVWVKEKRKEEQKYTVMTPIFWWEEQKYTEMVPAKQMVTKTRQVCKCVPVTEKQCICGKEVEVTCNKMVTVEETYQCEETVCVPVEKTRKCKVYDTRKEEKVHVCEYDTVVPQMRTKTQEVIVCEQVPERHVEKYMCCVPYEVEKQVQVRVCKMVPQTVKVPCCP